MYIYMCIYIYIYIYLHTGGEIEKREMCAYMYTHTCMHTCSEIGKKERGASGCAIHKRGGSGSLMEPSTLSSVTGALPMIL